MIGGGPVGLFTALLAHRRGLDVLVHERRPGPLDKACGEGLMPAGLALLLAHGIDPDGHLLRGIRYRDGTAVATSDFRSGPGRGVARTELHRSIAEAAQAEGVVVEYGAVGDVRSRPDHVEYSAGRARMIIAADGLQSPTRRELRMTPHAAARRWGVRQHYAVAARHDYVEVHWNGVAEAYVTPLAENLVGVAVLSADRAALARPLAGFEELACWVRGHEVGPRLGAGPLHREYDSRVAGRVLFVGDAAGYVDALTGEGLTLGFQAGAAAVEAVAANDPARYDMQWLALSRRHRLLTRALVSATRAGAVRSRIVPVAQRAEWLFGAAVNTLAG